MVIQGLQKMTLLDYPGHVACTVFLGGCDFRCQFCHNYELVEGPDSRRPKEFQNGEVVISSGHVILEKDFFAFLSTRKNLLDGVAITGGEPCLRHDLPDFIAKIREKGFKVKLDTNGNHPEMLRSLIDQRLINYVAVDIKNSPEKYTETVGLGALNLDYIRESIGLLINGTEKGRTVPYEFRTTVVNEYHEEKDFYGIGELIRGAKNYYLQPFVDRDTVPDRNLTSPSKEKLLKYREIASGFVENVEIRGLD